MRLIMTKAYNGTGERISIPECVTNISDQVTHMRIRKTKQTPYLICRNTLKKNNTNTQ